MLCYLSSIYRSVMQSNFLKQPQRVYTDCYSCGMPARIDHAGLILCMDCFMCMFAPTIPGYYVVPVTAVTSVTNLVSLISWRIKPWLPCKKCGRAATKQSWQSMCMRCYRAREIADKLDNYTTAAIDLMTPTELRELCFSLGIWESRMTNRNDYLEKIMRYKRPQGNQAIQA